MKLVIVLILFTSLVTSGQETNGGIKFLNGASWEKIKEIAKKENKYIFIDCMTTNCGWCKIIEKKVFSKEKVGNYINNHFISVRVQMDRSDKDVEDVRRWYSDAKQIQKEYKVSVYPTFLFFSPQGEVLHREYGGNKTEDEFIAVASMVFDRKNQYYTLLKNYLAGERDYSKIPYLIYQTDSYSDSEQHALAVKMQYDYLENFLLKLPINDSSLFTKENIKLMTSFAPKNLNKNVFDFIIKNSQVIDRVMDTCAEGYSYRYLSHIIAQESVDSFLKIITINQVDRIDKRDLDSIFESLSKRYNSTLAELAVLDSKIRWYDAQSDWSSYIVTNIMKIEKYGLDTCNTHLFLINELAGVIFYHSTIESELDCALSWMKIVIGRDPKPRYIATYANILYKQGKVKDAIKWQEKAVLMDKEEKVTQNMEKYGLIAKPDKTYSEVLKKMIKGIPTWSCVSNESGFNQ